MRRNCLRILFWLALPAWLAGCITYRGYPDPVAAMPAATERPRLTWLQQGSPGMFGGGPGLKQTLRESPLFSRVEQVSEPVDQGLFLLVDVQMLPPSLPAFAFGYLSFSTATLLPAWSTRDGYEVLFHIYRDGERVRSYEYSFYRGSFVWLPMILFVWVNLLTPDEEEAFRAVTERFLMDAADELRG